MQKHGVSAIPAEKLQRAREIFEAALDVQGQAREAVLIRGCAGDTELRAVVERMIEAESEAHTILDRPIGLAGSHVAPDEESFEPGMAVGPYRIIRWLGGGGMGTVYLTERVDGPKTDRYALKVMRFWSPGLMRRFRQEQSILSSLHHPNVARFLDSGTTDAGSPYFVMEYVGTPIHEFCDERGYSIEDRLSLFRDVCGAIRYLHQNLVVHRDLKPGNVLVTADGVVKLVDFGIAKPLPGYGGAVTFTQTMTAGLMTPDYASPEQIRGEAVSTLTDVYSLGIVLYELLTKTTPFAASRGQLHDKLRLICEEEPERPSIVALRSHPGGKQAARKLRGELENIILKAIQKEPERRYHSVEQFDEDLRRYLHRLPVLAQGDSRLYRAKKLLVRHRAGIAAVAAIVMLLAGGIVATTMEAKVARSERMRAEEQAGVAESAKVAAEIQSRKANEERARAEQEKAAAEREKTNAERRLEQIQNLAENAVRIYGPGSAENLPQDARDALTAEIVRDVLLTLRSEGKLAPGQAPVLDSASMDVHSYDLTSKNSSQLPAGWFVVNQPGQYRAGVDRALLYERKPTFFVRSLVPHPSGNVSVFQEFSARRYQGRRIRLTAFLQAYRAESSAARMFLEIDGGQRRANVSGTGPWKKFEVVADVPADTESIGFTVQFRGTGTLWMAKFSFEPVDRSVPLTPAITSTSLRG